MNRYLKLVGYLLVGFILSLIGVTQATTTDTTATQALVAQLDNIHSVHSTFEQVTWNADGKLIQKQMGKMWLQKPGLFRWEVTTPVKNLVVSDGQKVWNYDEDLEQVTIQRVNAEQHSPISFLLSGETRTVATDYQVTLLTDKYNKCVAESQHCFELVPTFEQAGFQKIYVGFEQGKIKILQLLDHLGQISRFVFQQIETNQSIAASQFQFVPPEGVDVVGD